MNVDTFEHMIHNYSLEQLNISDTSTFVYCHVNTEDATRFQQRIADFVIDPDLEGLEEGALAVESATNDHCYLQVYDDNFPSR